MSTVFRVPAWRRSSLVDAPRRVANRSCRSPTASVRVARWFTRATAIRLYGGRPLYFGPGRLLRVRWSGGRCTDLRRPPTTVPRRLCCLPLPALTIIPPPPPFLLLCSPFASQPAALLSSAEVVLDNSPTNQLAVSQVADWSTRGLVNSPTANFFY